MEGKLSSRHMVICVLNNAENMAEKIILYAKQDCFKKTCHFQEYYQKSLLKSYKETTINTVCRKMLVNSKQSITETDFIDFFCLYSQTNTEFCDFFFFV